MGHDEGGPPLDCLGLVQSLVDLGEIVAGKKPGRETDGERTVSINLGLALEDMATAVRVYRRAKAMNIGTELPL